MTWDTQATGRVKDSSTDYARYVPCSNLEHCQEQSRKALVSKYTWVYFVGLSTRSTNVYLKCLAFFQTLYYAYECVRCCFWYINVDVCFLLCFLSILVFLLLSNDFSRWRGKLRIQCLGVGQEKTEIKKRKENNNAFLSACVWR